MCVFVFIFFLFSVDPSVDLYLKSKCNNIEKCVTFVVFILLLLLLSPLLLLVMVEWCYCCCYCLNLKKNISIRPKLFAYVRIICSSNSSHLIPANLISSRFVSSHSHFRLISVWISIEVFINKLCVHIYLFSWGPRIRAHIVVHTQWVDSSHIVLDVTMNITDMIFFSVGTRFNWERNKREK